MKNLGTEPRAARRSKLKEQRFATYTIVVESIITTIDGSTRLSSLHVWEAKDCPQKNRRCMGWGTINDLYDKYCRITIQKVMPIIS